MCTALTIYQVIFLKKSLDIFFIRFTISVQIDVGT